MEERGGEACVQRNLTAVRCQRKVDTRKRAKRKENVQGYLTAVK
jgi:hypothetical protein